MVQGSILLAKGAGGNAGFFTDSGSFPNQLSVIGNLEGVHGIPELSHAAVAGRAVGDLDVVEVARGMRAHNEDRIGLRGNDGIGSVLTGIRNVLNLLLFSPPDVGQNNGRMGDHHACCDCLFHDANFFLMISARGV